MKSKTWKNLNETQEKKAKEYFLSIGGKDDGKITGKYEKWRIREENRVFTFYNSGTLYCNQLTENEVKKISSLLGEQLELPKKEYLIGLDETGKGEILGHCVLSGVLFPRNLLKKIDYLLGSADTKKRRTVEYWDDLFLELDELKKQGLIFLIEKIPPWHIDQYYINKIMDVIYQRILIQLSRKVDPGKCRIVLDDYGVGKNLLKYFDFLHNQGAEIIFETKADNKYVEARLASIIAKREKEKVMEAINLKYKINNSSVGSGNVADPQTKKWLNEWLASGEKWPWFVKKSFKPINQKIKKRNPPIRHDLLSEKSKRLLDRGELSIDSLSIICPKCGEIIKSCKITPSTSGKLYGRCINDKCNSIISKLNTTLRYYCCYIVPDSSVIISRTISKDLKNGRFFEGFNFVSLPEVREECDNRGGKREYKSLANAASRGKINLINFDTRKISKNGELKNDEIIVEAAKRFNAIIYTKDRNMYGTAMSKNIFCLTK